MSDDEILLCGTHEMSCAIRTGQATSAAIVTACLARIAKRDPALHAFVKVFDAEALKRAHEMDAEIAGGRYRGPLHGMPVAVKDIADIAGEVTGFGSRCYSAAAATRTARFIRHLEAAGAVIIGKTHTVEFAYGSWGTNHAVGTPVNPAMPGHTAPGGSSSGSAVAVAAGMVQLAIGTDTGGSVRIPASLCGVAGLKPSHGIISLDGVAPLCPALDTIGPLARDVAGLRMLLDAMRECPPAEVPDRPLRYRCLSRGALQPASAEVLDEYEAFVDRLNTPAAPVTELVLPRTLATYQQRCGNLMAYDAYRALGHLIDDPSAPLDPWVRGRIAVGRDIDDAAHRQAITDRREDIATFLADFGADDVLILPGTPFPTRPVADIDERQLPMSLYTRLANYLDLAAASLPLWQIGGAPVGVQIVMRHGQDDRLLKLLSAQDSQPAERQGAGA